MDTTFGPLEAMRLSVMTDSPVWVILSEVRLPGTRLKAAFVWGFKELSEGIGDNQYMVNTQ